VEVGEGVMGGEVRKEAGSSVDGSEESKGSVTKYIITKFTITEFIRNKVCILQIF
jgi:hypothetical protein